MNKKIVIALILVAVIIAGGIMYVRLTEPQESQPQACTLEAMICPDGSAVGRTEPNCSFAPCPDATADWQTHTDATERLSFKYPATLSTTFIRAQNWPPQVMVESGEYSCEEIERAGASAEEKTINGRKYCVQMLSEGAAGSVYLDYAYTTVRDNRVLVLTFTLQQPQCVNYDEPKQSQCEAERATFNVDNLADQIVQTVQSI